MKVQQYTQQYKTDRTPSNYVSNNVPYQAFRNGSDLSRSVMYTSKAITDTIDDLQKQEAEKEQDKIIELSNEYTSFELPLLYEQETGYYTTKGKTAIDNYESVWSQLNAKANSLIDEAELSASGKEKLQGVLKAKLNNTYQGLNTHAGKQRTEYQKNLYSDTLNNVFQKAIHNRYNATFLNGNMQDVTSISALYAKSQGLDESTCLKANKETFHTGVINQFIADGDRKAIEQGLWYLEKNKNDLSPENYSKFYNSLKDGQVNYLAQENANYLITIDENKAYGMIDNLREKDIELGDKTQSEYERLLKRIKADKESNDKQLLTQFQEDIFNAVQSSTPEQANYYYQQLIQSNLSAEYKLKAYDFFKKAQSADGFITNEAHKHLLENMAYYNADEFKNVNLIDYSLSREDYDRFSKLQREIGSESYTQQADLKKAVDKITVDFPYFANWGDRLKKPFVQDMVGLLSEIEKKHGKAFSFSVNKSGEITGTDKNTIKHYLEAFGYKNEQIQDKDIDELWEVYNKLKNYKNFNNNYFANKIAEFEKQNKRLPNGEDLYGILYKAYEEFEIDRRTLAKDNNVKEWSLNKAIVETVPRYGETKVLTYFADTRVKQLEHELGIKITSVDGSRFREINPKRTYISPHFNGDRLDISISEHTPENRIKLAEALLADNLVTELRTSDKAVLAHFKGHPKLKSLVAWDNKTGKQNNINHSNHFDLILNTKFGGKEQGQLTNKMKAEKLTSALKAKGFSDEKINQYLRTKGLV